MDSKKLLDIKETTSISGGIGSTQTGPPEEWFPKADKAAAITFARSHGIKEAEINSWFNSHNSITFSCNDKDYYISGV